MHVVFFGSDFRPFLSLLYRLELAFEERDRPLVYSALNFT